MKHPVTISAVLTIAVARFALCQDTSYEQPPHDYLKAKLDDPATTLHEAWEAGKTELDRSSDRAFVVSMLKQLGISEASQVLVFSKTSLQRDLITPERPRALYFNEDSYVGWVPGGLVEVVGMDSRLGPVFYSANPAAEKKVVPFERSENCMSCHGAGMTNDLPGLMVRSVYTDKRGMPILHAGTFLTDHTSPLEERWGGWYVTGNHGTARHMGNNVAEELPNGANLDREKFANITQLKNFFDTKPYPSGGSDIAALLVLEHQVGMHARLIEASYHVRGAIYRMHALQEQFGEPVTDTLSGSALSVAKSQAAKILEYMLFAKEAPLPSGGVEGDPAFQDAFRKNRVATKSGKSLKDFQLLSRIFKYRCSYLIYSRSFANLPVQLKDILFHDLKNILTSETPVAGYEHLSASERQSIYEILRETLPGLPADWK